MALGNEAGGGMRGARSVRARVGGCLELEFRKSRSCHARGQGPADIQFAARAKPPPCQTCGFEVGFNMGMGMGSMLSKCERGLRAQPTEKEDMQRQRPSSLARQMQTETQSESGAVQSETSCQANKETPTERRNTER